MVANMRRLLVLVATLGLLGARCLQADDPPPPRGTLCLAAPTAVLRVDGGCKAVEGESLPIDPVETDRSFLWIRDDKQTIAVGVLPAHGRTIDLRSPAFGTISLALFGEKARGWPAEAELHLAAADGHRFEVALPNVLAMSMASVRLPEGAYRFSVTAAHHLRLNRGAVAVRKGTTLALGALRLLAAPRLSATVVNAKDEPLPSAVVIGARGEVLAAASVEGTFVCELPGDLPPSVDILAAGFAPHRIPLEPRGGDIDLGKVTLRKGAVLHVVLDRTGIGAQKVRLSVLARGQDERFREVAGRDLAPTATEMTFPPIEAGDYFVGVKGPTPLERHVEALRLPDNGSVETRILIEPITVAGEVYLGAHPAQGGQIDLQPEGHGWEEAVAVGQDGTFQIELWDKGTFHGFYVIDPTRDGTFIHESLEVKGNPTHWHIVIADRTLSGRIYDKETGQPVPDVGLEKEFHPDAGSTGMGYAPVRPDGSYAMDALEPGDYTLKATARDYMPGVVHVRVTATDTARTADIPMEHGLTVPINFVAPSGEPVPHSTVIDGLGDGLNPENIYTSDGAGQLVLHLRPGDQKTLYVTPRSGSFAIADISADQAAAEGVRITVPAPAGTIRIHAAKDGKPLRGVVPLFRWNGRFLPPPVPRFLSFANPRYIGIWTDESGTAELLKMPAGIYEFYPCQSDEETAAVLRGTSSLAPVRIGFTGGTVDVQLRVGSGLR
jgi:hypothetical protein